MRVGCALAVVCCPVLIEIQAMTKSICTILFLTYIYIFNYTYILYVSIKIHIYIYAGILTLYVHNLDPRKWGNVNQMSLGYFN